MKEGQCRYFNGAQNKLCSRGIAYQQFRPGLPCIQLMHKSARGGTYLKAGEEPAHTYPFPGALPKERCPFYEEPTPEQVDADRRDMDAALERHRVAMKVASAWRVKPKPVCDRSETVDCPCCGGRLHLSQAAYNGHVHGHCETPGCVRWME